MSIHVFGIRHHGPGCARSLRAALTELQPDIVLVEGPPDAQEVLPLMMHENMQPPVALLVYASETPKQAVYYPASLCTGADYSHTLYGPAPGNHAGPDIRGNAGDGGGTRFTG
jgi:hypothetical protein